jgi:hypothetical protein
MTASWGTFELVVTNVELASLFFVHRRYHAALDLHPGGSDPV